MVALPKAGRKQAQLAHLVISFARGINAPVMVTAEHNLSK